MREILFRGKRVDTGEWVYGSFVPDLLEVFNGFEELDGFIKPFEKTPDKRRMVEVERSTVSPPAWRYASKTRGPKSRMRAWPAKIWATLKKLSTVPVFPRKETHTRRSARH